MCFIHFFLAINLKIIYETIMETSNYILKARKKLKIRQKDMALLLGVRQVNLCKWEKGNTMPPGKIILRIMELLKRKNNK